MSSRVELCLSTLYTGCIGVQELPHVLNFPLPQHTLYRLHPDLGEDVDNCPNFASAHSIQVASVEQHTGVKLHLTLPQHTLYRLHLFHYHQILPSKSLPQHTLYRLHPLTASASSANIFFASAHSIQVES